MEDLMERYGKIELGLKCYIYPKGGCAEVVVNILRDIFPQLEIAYIDDSQPEISLEARQDSIRRSGAYCLVCAGDVQNILLDKCRGLKMDNVIDGREFVAFHLGNKIEQETRKILQGQKAYEFLEQRRVLHVLPNRWITHYYYFYDLFVYYLADSPLEYVRKKVMDYCQAIEKALAQDDFSLETQKGVCAFFDPIRLLPMLDSLTNKIPILYLFGSFEWYQKNKSYIENQCAVIVQYPLADFFAHYSIFVNAGSSLPKLSNRMRTTIGIGHSFSDAFMFCCRAHHQEYLFQYIRYYFLGMDFYVAIDKESLECYQNIIKELGLNLKILPLGSLSLDKRMTNIVQHKAPKQFYFLPRACPLDIIVEAIDLFLQKGKKVIFRPHPAFENFAQYAGKNRSDSFFDKLIDHPLFSIDNASSIPHELLAESIVITDNSSVAYSAPLLALKPAILFCPPMKSFDLRLQRFGKSFANPLLHRVALSIDEFLKVALELEEELLSGGGAMFNTLYKWRAQNVFNLGHSKEAFIECLINLLQE